MSRSLPSTSVAVKGAPTLSPGLAPSDKRRVVVGAGNDGGSFTASTSTETVALLVSEGLPESRTS